MVCDKSAVALTVRRPRLTSRKWRNNQIGRNVIKKTTMRIKTTIKSSMCDISVNILIDFIKFFIASFLFNYRFIFFFYIICFYILCLHCNKIHIQPVVRDRARRRLSNLSWSFDITLMAKWFNFEECNVKKYVKNMDYN